MIALPNLPAGVPAQVLQQRPDVLQAERQLMAAQANIGDVMKISVVRSVHRVPGTLFGLGIFGLIVQIHPPGLWRALIVALLQFATEAAP